MNQLLKATPLATQLPSVPPSSNRHFIKTTGLVLAVAALLAVLWMPAAPGLPPTWPVRTSMWRHAGAPSPRPKCAPPWPAPPAMPEN